MRAVTLSFATAALLKMCGAAPEAAPLPVAAAAPSAITVTATHGGVLVPADDAWIELVTKQDGEVEAYVVDRQGAPMPSVATGQMHVQVQGSDGAHHPVQLVWDPNKSGFSGRAEITPVVGPAHVQLTVAGRPPRVATAPIVVVVPPSPTVVIERPRAQRVVVEAPRPQATVVVQAPRPQATVVVQAPSPTFVVERPRASVVIQAPPPPVVYVEPPHATVVVEGRGHPGRGHAYGHRGRGGVVVQAPAPRAQVVVHAPAPPSVSVGVHVHGGGGHGGHGGGHGGHGRGHGRH